MDYERKSIYSQGWRRFTYMEPPIFILLLNYGMTGTVFTDMIVYRTCQSIVANASTCDILHTNSSSKEAMELDKIVQPHASYITLCDSLVDGIIPAAMILFMGPWSDKFGRKPLLIAGYLAPTLHYFIVSLLSLRDLSPWFFLSASVPSALLGGEAVVMLSSFCFISDVTTSETRAWHLAFLESCLTTGVVIGTFIGPFIFEKFGYSVLFLLAGILSIVALLYIIFYVPETVQKEMNERWRNPFDYHLIKELVKTTTKKRPGLNRWTLWNCILILSFFVLIIDGDSHISYLFINARLGWNTVQYSTYKSIAMVLTIVGTILGMKLLQKYFNFSDVTEALLGCISGFFTSITLAFSWKPWHLYLGTSLGLFTGMISPTVRSILSTSAPSIDMGKIFSLITFMETILPLAGASLYTLIYSQYMPPVYPSPVYLLSTSVFLVMIIFVLLIDWRMRRYPAPIEHVSIQEEYLE